MNTNRSMFLSVLRRPSLWATAIGTLVSLAPHGWWRRPPFLPMPDREAVDWRLTTAYGSPEATLADDDLVAYLEWRRRVARGNGG